MAKCVRVLRNLAEGARQKLSDAGLLDNAYAPEHKGNFVYFAVRGEPAGMYVIDRELQKRQEGGKPLREELKGKLTEKEAEELVASFDIVGDIAVLEIPPILQEKEKLIADAILRNHRNVKVVAKKIGATEGEFRIRPVEVIAGTDRTNAIYKEAGCEFELDLNSVYFSPRLSTERARIAALVKKDERVLIPFAGVGPFAIIIGKKVPSARIIGIDLNHSAVEFFWKNIERNRCENVIAMVGDVKHVLPGEFRNWADRAVMPLPKDAHLFLHNVIPCVKKGGMLHYYSFGDAAKPYEKAEKELAAAAARLSRSAKMMFRRVVRPYSKSTVQVVIDAKID